LKNEKTPNLSRSGAETQGIAGKVKDYSKQKVRISSLQMIYARAYFL
jgi:hypothetical protein